MYNGGTTETGYTDDYNTIGPKVVISARGSAGFVNRVKTNFWAGNSCYTLYPKDDTIYFDYLYYAIKDKQSLMENKLQTGGGVPALNKGQVEQVEVLIPSIDEQKRIASILSTFGSLIEQIDTEVSNISNQKQAIMDKIFR